MSNPTALAAIKKAKALAEAKKKKQGSAPKTKKPVTKKPAAKKTAKKKAVAKVAKKKAPVKTAPPKSKAPAKKKAVTKKKTAAKSNAPERNPKSRRRLTDEQREKNYQDHYRRRRLAQAEAAFENRVAKGVPIPEIVDDNPHLDFTVTEDGNRVRYRVYGLNRFEAIRKTPLTYEPSVADALIRGFSVGVRKEWTDKETKEEHREFFKYAPGDAELWETVRKCYAKGAKRTV